MSVEINNALAMTDEDFMRAMESQEDQVSKKVIEDTQVTESESIEPETTQENDDSNADTEVKLEEEAKEQSQEVEPNNTESSDTESTEATEPETTEIDYKAFYESVTKDFKASGKVMPGVKDPEKFIKALQMATDYALKTAAIKPALKRVKLLEDVSDAEFEEMLDFRKRNPEVIKKALKDANLDPIDLDMEHVNYVPQQRVPSDAEYEYREVVEDLAKDAKFTNTRNVILNELDPKSKEMVLTDTRVLKALHEEVASGRFEQIQAQAVQLRAFGNIPSDVPDLELFASIAKQMDENSGKIGKSNPSEVSSQVISNTQSKPVTNPVDPELEDKRARAGIQTKVQSKTVKKYDPTKLSDEEFMQLLSDGAEFI